MYMRYEFPFHYMDHNEFESLAVDVCSELFGKGVRKFGEGVDGGIDASFEGTAENFPSNPSPWEGKTVIQVKHTSKEDSTTGESSFIKLIEKEYEKHFKDKPEKYDNYLLITNRKFTGVSSEKFDKIFETKNFEIIGRESLSAHVYHFDSLISKYKLNTLYIQPEIYDDDLREFFEVFLDYLENNKMEISEIKQNTLEDLDIINLEEKNKLNSVSKHFFNDIKKAVEKYGQTIDEFLRNPINSEYWQIYENITYEIHFKIPTERNEPFILKSYIDEIYDRIFQFWKSKKSYDKLKNKRRVLFNILCYMYFNCDIGIKE